MRPFSSTYRDLEDELLAIVLGLKGVENGRELVGIELDCWAGAGSVYRASVVTGRGRGHGAGVVGGC